MLDLRLPIGLFFLVIGVILTLSGAIGHDTARVGLPVDLDWGICMLVFGALMTFFGYRGQMASDAESEMPSNSAAGSPATPPHSAAQELEH